MERIKLLLIAGHGEGDPGACSTMAGVEYRESDYTRELVNLLSVSFSSGNVEVSVYDMEKNCYKQNKAGTGPDFSAYDYIFEVHFNAKAKGDGKSDNKFTGIGFYVHTGIRGVSVEKRILANVVDLGFKQWADGIFYVSNLLNCNIAYRKEVDYALLEMAFIDDLDDMTWYNANKKAVAAAIADGIIDGFGVRLEETQVETEAGWRQNEIGWWYMDSDGKYYVDGIVEIDNRFYAFNEDGYMLTGLQEIGGKRYYFCQEPGHNEGAMMLTDGDGALTEFFETE